MGHGGLREVAVTVGVAGAGVILAAIVALTPAPESPRPARAPEVTAVNPTVP